MIAMATIISYGNHHQVNNTVNLLGSDPHITSDVMTFNTLLSQSEGRGTPAQVLSLTLQVCSI